MVQQTYSPDYNLVPAAEVIQLSDCHSRNVNASDYMSRGLLCLFIIIIIIETDMIA